MDTIIQLGSKSTLSCGQESIVDFKSREQLVFFPVNYCMTVRRKKRPPTHSNKNKHQFNLSIFLQFDLFFFSSFLSL